MRFSWICSWKRCEALKLVLLCFSIYTDVKKNKGILTPQRWLQHNGNCTIIIPGTEKQFLLTNATSLLSDYKLEESNSTGIIVKKQHFYCGTVARWEPGWLNCHYGLVSLWSCPLMLRSHMQNFHDLYWQFR